MNAQVFDSSVIILFLNDQLPDTDVAQMLGAMDSDAALVSAITRAEVLAWPSHTQQSLHLSEQFLNLFRLCEVDARTADEGARIRRTSGLKLPDALIAATASLRNAAVVTANGRDFGRVAGLEVLRV